MTMRRRVLLPMLLAVTAVALLILGRAGGSPAQLATLRIEVVGLPDGVSADAAALSEDRQAQGAHKITGPSKITVTPGKYRITAATVKTPHASHPPAERLQHVTARPGHTTVVVIDYFETVPNATKVAPPGAITAVAAHRVTLTDSAYAHSLSPGTFIASGISAATPHTYAARVVSVAPASGGHVVATVNPVNMLWAIPRMAITSDVTMGHGMQDTAWTSAAGIRPALADRPSGKASGILGDCEGITPDVDLSVRPDLKIRLHHDIELNIPSVDLDFHGWKPHVTVHPPVQVKTLTVQEDASVELTYEFKGEVGFKCTLASPTAYKFVDGCQAAADEAALGEIDAKCSPTLRAQGEISVSDGVDIGASYKRTVAATYGYEKGHWKAPNPTTSGQANPFYLQPKAEVRASMSVGPLIHLEFGIGQGNATVSLFTENWEYLKGEIKTDLIKGDVTFTSSLGDTIKVGINVPGKDDAKDKSWQPVERLLYTTTLAHLDHFEHNLPARVQGSAELPANLRLPYETESVSGRPLPALQVDSENREGFVHVGKSGKGWRWLFDPCVGGGWDDSSRFNDPNVTSYRILNRRMDDDDSVDLAGRGYAQQQLATFKSVSAAKAAMEKFREDAAICPNRDETIGVVRKVFSMPRGGSSESGFAALVENRHATYPDDGQGVLTDDYYQAARMANTIILTLVPGVGPSDIRSDPRADVAAMTAQFATELCHRTEWSC